MDVDIANHIEKHKLSIVRWKWRKCVSKSCPDVQKLDTNVKGYITGAKLFNLLGLTTLGTYTIEPILYKYANEHNPQSGLWISFLLQKYS